MRDLPEAVRNLTVTFRYNDIASVEQLSQRWDGMLVIMEPATTEEPRDGFLQSATALPQTWNRFHS